MLKKKLAMLLALSLCLGLSACSYNKQEKEEVPPLKVFALSPSISDLESYKTVTGKSVPTFKAVIKAELSEKVTKVYKKVGDYVKKGELLMELDSESTEVSIKSAQAELENAKANAQKLTGSTIDSAINSAENGNTQVKNARKVMEANLDLIDVNLMEIRGKIREIDGALTNLDQGINGVATAIAGIDQMINSGTLPPTITSGKDAPISAVPALSAIPHPPEVKTLGQLKAHLEAEKEKVLAGKAQLDQAREQLNTSYRKLSDTYYNSEELMKDQTRLSDEILTITKTELKDELSKTADAILTVSEISYRNALNALNKTKVFSPIDGYVDSCSVKENNMVAEGAEVFTVSERQAGQIEMGVSGKSLSSLEVGTKISLSDGARVQTATIKEIPPMVDMETGLFKVVADLDTPDQAVFGASYFVRLPSDKKLSVLTLPISSVYFEGGKSFVFLVEEQGGETTAKRQEIETGIYNDKEIQVVSGLSEKDRVISSWSEKLTDGVKIEIAEDSTESNTESITETEKEEKN